MHVLNEGIAELVSLILFIFVVVLVALCFSCVT
jgi:hypothetical protein